MKKKKKITDIKIIDSDPQEFIAIYFYEVIRCLESLDKSKLSICIDMLMEAYRKGRTVFILGNGGSASTASHMACDLGKGIVQNKDDTKEKRFKVISLVDNTAIMTAIANDISFEDVFVEQLKNLMAEDDVIIAISGSGNSKNVLKAIEYANEYGGKTIGLLGFKNGGRLASKVDCAIIVDSIQYGPIEDIHLILNHLIASWIAKRKTSSVNKGETVQRNKSVPFI